MNITAFFALDNLGVAGLSPTLDIVQVDTGAVIGSFSMTAIPNATGWYAYDFDATSDVEYVFTADAGTASVDVRYQSMVGSINNESASQDVAAVWYTYNGSPVTGLTPTIDIIRISDDQYAIDNQSMTELQSAPGWYIFTYNGYEANQTYLCIADANTDTVDQRIATGIVNMEDTSAEASLRPLVGEKTINVVQHVLAAKSSSRASYEASQTSCTIEGFNTINANQTSTEVDT